MGALVGPLEAHANQKSAANGGARARTRTGERTGGELNAQPSKRATVAVGGKTELGSSLAGSKFELEPSKLIVGRSNWQSGQRAQIQLGRRWPVCCGARANSAANQPNALHKTRPHLFAWGAVPLPAAAAASWLVCGGGGRATGGQLLRPTNKRAAKTAVATAAPSARAPPSWLTFVGQRQSNYSRGSRARDLLADEEHPAEGGGGEF